MQSVLSICVAVLSVVCLSQAGYVGSPAYGAHYGYGYSPLPVVKSLSSVAVAHAPLATSYANTYKISHPVVKHYTPLYYSPLYSTYGHGHGHVPAHAYDYDYPLYSPYYLHK